MNSRAKSPLSWPRGCGNSKPEVRPIAAVGTPHKRSTLADRDVLIVTG